MEPIETTPNLDLPAEVLATLAEIGEEINASLDLDKVLSKTAALVRKIIDYEIFSVLLLDERTQLLFHRFAIGYTLDAARDWQIPLGQGITGFAAATRKPVRVGDVRSDSRYINLIESVRSELAVPLVYEGRSIGVLDIQSSQPDYFTHEQQNILALLAGRLAIAIENARLFERVRSQADTLRVLNEIGREASSILDVEELLRRAAELVKRVIDYQILSILLYDEATNMFRHRLDIKYGQSVQGKFRVIAGEGIIGAAATSGQPVRVADVSTDSRYLMVNPETRSELAIPMIHKGRVVGVLDLESPQPNYFTEDHVQTLSILSGALAVSLENARLYGEIARNELRMERELSAAQRMQGALLRPVPKEDYGLDIAARILSAREVCGDLYDFLRYGSQQLGVALGDVSGKGSEAALYGAVAIGILRSLSPLKLQPAEFLRQLNHLICERRIEGRFITLCYATWQKARRRFRVANAGQSQPIVCRGDRCELIRLSGFPLGLYDEVTYEEWSTTLDVGDIVVFYSDGLSEAASPDGHQFGSNRLRELIARHRDVTSGELADILLAAIQDFTSGAALADDRTLLVVKAR
jgi:sigma-B regulation protein RsbU (phosphoserine phosphatase)